MSETTPRLNAWAKWTLRGLLDLEGAATPKELESRVALQLAPKLSPGQINRVLRNNYLRFGAVDLRQADLLGGTRGRWVLTPSGRTLAASLVGSDIEVPSDIEEMADEDAQYNGPTDTVPATDFEGYHVPILRALRNGPMQKQELLNGLEASIRDLLLPGDQRVMVNGMEVWRFRASWALSELKKLGHLENASRGVWQITETGRQSLDAADAPWRIEAYQGSKRATVRSLTNRSTEQLNEWPTEAWRKLERLLPAHLLDAVARRLRPDLGAAPALERGTLPRNLVLYGPPGTGKTFVASAIASALTEETQRTSEGNWRFVQFHPSYAYEDFVQGMRPDLKQQTLRYELRDGPFQALCKAANQSPEEFFVLVIDEINRGDPARVFGELLYALEYRSEPVDLALGGQLVVPPNVVVIGTMNSVDRSVALVDYALRRRFAFIRLDPDPSAIVSVRGDTPAVRRAAEALASLNKWLVARLDREHAVGHSFFLNPSIDFAEPDALDVIWENDLLPLLEEYFVGDRDGLASAIAEWARIVEPRRTSS